MTRPLIKTILALAFLLTILSCNRVKTKGQEIVNTTKEKAIETKQEIIDQKNNLADKIFPSYDSGKPDTENNKKRFTEHLTIDLTNDIKNIYCYGDFMGIDYKVLISFTCDTSTINRILRAKGMTISQKDHDSGLSFSAELPWWHKEIIERIRPYKVGKEYEYWHYLWYDKKTRTAYYEEFSM